MLVLGLLLVWTMSAMAGPGEGAGVTVDFISDPAPERIVPGSDLVQVTLAASWHGTPLQHGQLTMKILAPPPAGGLFRAFPPVEGTELLRLTSELNGGRFSLQYLFPIRGTYGVELELTAVPGGEPFPATTWRHAWQVGGSPSSVRWTWLLMGGLFILGAGVGLVLSRQTTPRMKPLSSLGAMVLLGVCYVTTLSSPPSVGADHPMSSVLHFPRGPQVIRGDDGWELVVRPTPVQARVGEPWHLAMSLNKAGQVFPQRTEVALNVYQLRDDKPMLRTQVIAPSGFVTQRLQLFDSAPHTCTVTARPLDSGGAEPVALTAVLGVDVTTSALTLGIDLRLLAILGAMLAGGLVAGFVLPRLGKETERA
jgi:hypothetical protein